LLLLSESISSKMSYSTFAAILIVSLYLFVSQTEGSCSFAGNYTMRTK